MLHRMLEAAGIPVWRDTASLWPGEDWRARIREAITRDTLVFIACFSSHSAARRKSHQNEELLLAIDQLRLRQPDVPWLMPVRFDDCVVPDLELGAGRTLASIERADLFGPGRDMAAWRLMGAVQRLLWEPARTEQGWRRDPQSAQADRSLPQRVAAKREDLFRCARTLIGHSSGVEGVAFSPDGALLATTSHDETARLWDLATGTCLHTIAGHTSGALGVAFSPDGALLAITSHDGTVRLWDPVADKNLCTLTGHTSWVRGVAFSPDGTSLATASNDGTVRLWQ